MTDRPRQVSSLAGELDSAYDGSTVTMRFPLETLDYRNRFFDADSFLNLGEPPTETKILWQHDMFSLPIGVALSTIIEDGFLVTKARMAKTEMADDIVSLLKMEPPALNAVSIGWIPGRENVEDRIWADGTKIKARRQMEVRLLDVSPVNFPGMQGTSLQSDAADFASRMVPTHGGRIKQTEGWDEDVAIGRLRLWWTAGKFSDYEQGFATVEGDPDSFDSYKFPHHDVDAQGLFLSTAGVTAAWAASQGARSGQPDEDAQRHLAQHREAISGDAESVVVRRWQAVQQQVQELAGKWQKTTEKRR